MSNKWPYRYLVCFTSLGKLRKWLATVSHSHWWNHLSPSCGMIHLSGCRVMAPHLCCRAITLSPFVFHLWIYILMKTHSESSPIAVKHPLFSDVMLSGVENLIALLSTGFLAWDWQILFIDTPFDNDAVMYILAIFHVIGPGNSLFLFYQHIEAWPTFCSQHFEMYFLERKVCQLDRW